eukprot:scpid93390/ scgid25053/ Pogo transposable element with KRAB domain
MSELKIHSAVVPGGCTKYAQAPDVSWNIPFKAAISRSHEDWMASDVEKEVTCGGNPRPPPIAMHLQWVVDAWNGFSTDLLEIFFKACGIMNDLDGLEDDQIHCFKPHGLIPEGLEVQKSKSSSHTISEPVLVCTGG